MSRNHIVVHREIRRKRVPHASHKPRRSRDLPSPFRRQRNLSNLCILHQQPCPSSLWKPLNQAEKERTSNASLPYLRIDTEILPTSQSETCKIAFLLSFLLCFGARYSIFHQSFQLCECFFY